MRRIHLCKILTLLLFIPFLGSVSLAQTTVALSDAQGEHEANGLNSLETTHRAPITDVNGLNLAVTVDVDVLCHIPEQVDDIPATVSILKGIFPSADEDYLRQRLGSNNVWLSYEVNPLQKRQIIDANIVGIEFCETQRRAYPYGPLFAHVIGVSDLATQGLLGLERHLNPLFEDRREPVRTTLDMKVQEQVAAELSQQIEAFEATGGSAILMRIDTTEVVSLVSLPTYDPNNLEDMHDPRLFNRAVQGEYEFGAPMMPFTYAAAMEEGLIEPHTLIDGSRNLQVGDFTISGYVGAPRGIFSAAECLELSSNICAARVADLLGAELQQDYFSKFSLTRPVEIEQHRVGIPAFPKEWDRLRTMTNAYGFGNLVTPVHMVAAYSALVNGGIYQQPTLLADPNEPRGQTRVISEETSAKMRDLLQGAVPTGFGKLATVSDFGVGGMVGTLVLTNEGRDDCEACEFVSFIGAFPIDDPKYAMLVAIENPKPQEWSHGYATGGWVAAPVFERIVEQIAPLLELEDQSATTVSSDIADVPDYETTRRERPMIVIDPGHGGNDPGAVTLQGLQEADLALKIGRQIVEALRADDTYEVLNLRGFDAQLSVFDRVALINAAKPDFFVSLHLSANPNPVVSGLTVFTLSQAAADQWAADHQDQTNPISLRSRYENIVLSKELADLFIEEIRGDVRLVDQEPLRSAGFMILRVSNAPGILVEAGHMTNPFDVSALQIDEYSNDIATSLRLALDRYFEPHL